MVRGQRHAPVALYTRIKPCTHCLGGWVGPRAGLDRCGKSRSNRDSVPGPDRAVRIQSVYRLSYPAHFKAQRYTYIPHATTLRNAALFYTNHLNNLYNPQNDQGVFLHKSLVRLSCQTARRLFPDILYIIRLISASSVLKSY